MNEQVNEQTEVRYSIKKTLLFSVVGVFLGWVVMVMGVVLFQVAESWSKPSHWNVIVVIAREGEGLYHFSVAREVNDMGNVGREQPSIVLMGGTLILSAAWLLYSRRFSLRKFLLLALAAGCMGLIPQLEIQEARPPVGTVAYGIHSLPRISSAAVAEFYLQFERAEALKELPEELRKRLESASWTVKPKEHYELTLDIRAEGTILRKDMESLIAFYGQYMDILVRDQLAQQGVELTAARVEPRDSEWSRRWAPTFEAEYRARKAVAKALAEKEKKPEGP